MFYEFWNFFLGFNFVREHVLILVDADQSLLNLIKKEVQGLTSDKFFLNEAHFLRLEVNQHKLTDIGADSEEMS